ncbi:DUF6600 domain-containing protein [Aromatoleum diolicum]|uniref:Prolin-rich exported protein n=1 Tax=Aromatoleum diolicum TaxID=75796 RepID=A0ABX1Q8Z4_9RHOO|nr:DUF6600 domain-containing protein [Aromatoleum diolicum]NMG73977.1 hypothetical protein [Aromatoleum diolicum]
MKTQSLRLRTFAFLAGVVIFGFSGWAGADPPSRVARLAYMAGEVSFSPAGDNDWFQATTNRPLTTGDRLWVDDGARAELQTGGTLVRMNAGTSVSVLNLDDQITQLQLTQGTLNVRVRRLAPNQVFEIATPNLAFTLREPGAFRIEVDPEGDATTIFVRRGQGEVYGEDAAYVIDSQQPYRFMGTDLREYEYVDAQRTDDFDRWASSRDRRYDDSRSARYVSEDVVGYQDLDEHGSWRVDATYGNVWYPSRVASGWAPYRDGHWAWIDPWGWTWVDDAPWGFAVSHYGRWAHVGGTWGWIPGPVRSRAYYAPALVVFVGGDNFQLTISSGLVGGVAWFPLGPREVYRPAYQVSRSYFENINRSNTVVNTTVINNYYNNTNVTNVVYANRNVQGAVVAVPTTTFVQSQPVSKAAVRVSREMVGSAPLALVAPVAPTEKSVRGAAAQRDKPPARVLERRVVARTAPPAAPVGFAAQQQQLSAKPGKPLDESARKELKPAASAPVVKVVAQKQEAPPTVRPPPAASGAKAGDARGKSEQRGRGEERGQPVAPQPETPKDAVQPQVTPPQATPEVPAAQSREPRGRSEQRGDDEQRGRSEQRGNDEQRGQSAAPRPTSPQRPAEPELAPPRATPATPAVPTPATRTTPAVPAVPATPAVPAAQAPEPRGKSDQRDAREERRERQQREQAVTPPPAPARGGAQPEAAPPQATPAVPAAQPREPRDRSEPRGNGSQREREQAVAPPPAAPKRAAEPRVAPPPPDEQPPRQRARPESAPATRQAEPRPPAAAPRQAPPPPPPVPAAEPRTQEPRPAAGRARDKDKTSEEQKQEEEKREEQRRREERRN